jgi:hypothetical protein
MSKFDYSKNKHCSCGKLITNKSIRCQVCAMKFLFKNSESHSKGWHHTKCSLKKMSEIKKELYKDPTRNPNYIDGKSLKTNLCQNCGKELKNIYAKFCKKCMELGERNHRFIDGRSHIDYPEVWNKSLKRQIMERDKFTCQYCGKYPTKLCVHHIDCNKQNCKEDNLIALCRKCHGQIHNKEIL